MPGTLFIVATPIGNLEDLTLRATRILGEVDLVAAEDTRHTRMLLRHLGLATPTTSLYAQNEHRKTPALLERLRAGTSIALVSDAGTPTISDPGQRLVAAAHEAGIPVVPVPGPSALLAALSASGFDARRFRFEGFAPRKPAERRAWYLQLADCDDVIVFFEAPHRIRQTLSELAKIIGERPIVLGRELTKLHEQLVKGPIHDVLNDLNETKGEMAIVIGPAVQVHEPAKKLDAAAVYSMFCEMTENTALSRRQVVKNVGKRLGIPARRVYELIEEAKKSSECPNRLG